MEGQNIATQVDSLLLPFMCAAHEIEEEECLARVLAEHAIPVVRGVIAGRFHDFLHGGGDAFGHESEDLEAEVVVSLIARLRALKSHPGAGHIADFRGYAAAVAFNACHRRLRLKYPARRRLKNRLRLLLTRHEGFALWEEGGGELLCGLGAWRGRAAFPAPAGRLEELRDDARVLTRAGLLRGDARQAELADLVASVFRWLGAPLRLDVLVSLVADLQEIHESVRDVPARETRVVEEFVPDQRPSAADELQARQYLARLWTEIVDLPPLQRAALLLNLREPDGGPAVALLPLAGVASLRQIADALGITREQLAELWNELPLEDARIAVRLNVTRQQVINLRKAARARLGRRLKSFEEGKGRAGGNITPVAAS
jgi:hypothetical protein